MRKIACKLLMKHRGPLSLVTCFFLVTVSYAKIGPLAEIKKLGFYGRVHAWSGIPQNSHEISVDVPSNAPIIISDYHSKFGANGLPRTGNHAGIDLFADTGSPIIAAADGVVIKALDDSCWGPTVLIKHGLDRSGKTIYALYGHMRNIMVKAGQAVKRGSQIAEMGEDIFNSCGSGFHHLHFQISYKPGMIPFGWGWASFVSDGTRAPNPHRYWEDGVGKITCFQEGRQYSNNGLTYPLPCANSGLQLANGMENASQYEKIKQNVSLALEKTLKQEERLIQQAEVQKRNAKLAHDALIAAQQKTKEKEDAFLTIDHLFMEAQNGRF